MNHTSGARTPMESPTNQMYLPRLIHARTGLLPRIFTILVIILAAGCKDDSPDLTIFDLLTNGFQPVLQTEFTVGGEGNNGSAMEFMLNSTINLSNTQVYCVFQDLNLPSTMDTLHLAYLRGVDVRVGLDEDNKDGIGYTYLSAFLSTEGDEPHLTVGNAGDGKVYMNMCVGDRRRVWAGSVAPTVQEMYYQHGYSFYLQSQEDGIMQKFNVVMDLITHGSFGSTKQRLNRRNHWLVGGTDVGIYFGPEESPLEGFIIPRIMDARSSLRVFSNEIFSNELDSSDNREAFDLAYEMARLPVQKHLVTNWHSSVASDPDATINSVDYLTGQGTSVSMIATGWPVGGASFILMDSNDGSRITFVTSGPYSQDTDSKHDSFTFVFEDVRFAATMSGYYDNLNSRSGPLPGTSGDTFAGGNSREVVINELNWMGGYDSDQTSAAGNYIELFNNTYSNVNLSGWQFICNDGGGDVVTITVPNKSVIGPRSYFLIARSSSNIVETAHATVSFGSMPDDLDTCRLVDSGANTIDTIGVTGQDFALDENSFGLNDTTNRVRRSMERDNPASAGDTAGNWHTNSNTGYGQNFNIKARYIGRTYGTPGLPNSPNVPLGRLLNGVIINEACEDNATCAGGSDYVELYNTNNYDIDLSAARAYLQGDTSCDLTNGVTNRDQLSGTIPANGYLVF
ncbi:MAG: lamin tail domain-containing protein, partial [Leptospiraceae bacterium]|nr:lamin tail domain-containing protein [Leptospiraceae bacterium]